MNKDKRIKIYGASGWFTPRTEQYISDLEELFKGVEDVVEFYSPRRDGTKLTPEQFHDHATRARVFQDNVDNILSADLVLANVDGHDGYLDTGTIWEVGFAMSKGIPVFGATLDEQGFEKTKEILGAIVDKFTMVYDKEQLYKIFNPDNKKEDIFSELEYWINKQGPKGIPETIRGNKVLVIGPTKTEEDTSVGKDVVSVIMENKTSDIKWVDDIYHENLSKDIDKVFENTEFMVAVIDGKNSIVSWMMGQCYGRKIPLVSYTNNDNSVNLMLLLSIVRHIKGKEELADFLQLTKRVLIDDIETGDTSNVKAI